MPIYTITNPNAFDVNLPFRGGAVKAHSVVNLSLEAHTVDSNEVQLMLNKGLIRITVADNTSRDDTIEIFPGPHPPGADLLLPPSAADPASTLAGAQYYNTSINTYLTYDASRSKWLSKAEPPFEVGRNGQVAAGSFYRGINGRVLSATIGKRALFNGTVVGFSYTRSDTDAATFNITSNGVTIASVASTAINGGDTTLNADFNQGDVLAVQNDAGGNETSNVQAYLVVKWRS